MPLGAFSIRMKSAISIYVHKREMVANGASPNMGILCTDDINLHVWAYTFAIFLIMAINTEYRMSWASGYNGGASNLENPLVRRAIGKCPLKGDFTDFSSYLHVIGPH